MPDKPLLVSRVTASSKGGPLSGGVLAMARRLLSRGAEPRITQRIFVDPRRALMLLTAGALALRVAGVWFGWPYVTHPDEPRIIARSMHILQPLFDGDPTAIDLNPHFYTYPSLYLYFLAFAFALVGLLLAPLHLLGAAPDLLSWYQQQPAAFHVLARLINAAIGAATVPLLYRLGARLWSPAAGLAAAAFLAVNPLHMEESHFATTDVPATLLAVAAVLAAGSLYRHGRLRDCLLAGALSGLAAGVKYPTGLIFTAVMAAALLRLRPPAQRCTTGLASPVHPLLGLALAALAFVDAFVVSTPFVILDPRSVLNDLLSEWIATRSGILGATHDDFFFYVTPPDPRIGLGLLGLIGLATGVLLWARRSVPSCLLLLSAALPAFLLVSTSLIKIERYVLPAVPFMTLLAAPSMLWIARRLAPVLRPAPLAAGVAAAVLLAQPAIQAGGCAASQFRPDPRSQLAAWAAAHVPADTPVLVPKYGNLGPELAGAGVTVQFLPQPYDDRVRERIRWEARTLQRPVVGPLLAMALARRVHTPAMAERRLTALSTIDGTPAPTLPAGHTVYVAITDLLTGLYQDPDTARFYPDTTASWRAFLQDLDAGAGIVAAWDSPSAWCISFLKAPSIRLYRSE